MKQVTVIAEIGINHQGNMDLARAMIRRSAEAGADIAKFQWYDPADILGKDHPCYQEALEAQFGWHQHAELKRYCDEVGIEWCVSIFHDDQIKTVEDLGLKRYKIASRAVLNEPLLDGIAKTGKPVVISTGLCDAGRLSRLGGIFNGTPKTLLYCVMDYPTRLDRINLEKMAFLRRYSSSIGFSSHCPRIAPTLAAVARGASVTENHVVLDKGQKGCDVSSSLSFEELRDMVAVIRDMEELC